MSKIILLSFLFTTSAYLDFGQTNTFPSSGSVGIGTLTPSEKLQVTGGKIFVGSPTIIDSYDQLYSAGSFPGFRLEVQRPNGGAAFDFANIYAHKTSATGDALWGKLGVDGSFGTSGTSTTPIVYYMYFGTEPTVSYSNNTFRLYPNKNAYFDGSVGIGNTSPAYSIDIEKPSANIGLTSTTGSNNVYYRITNGAGTSWLGSENSSGGSILPGSLPYSTVLTTNSANIQFGTANNVRMTISSSGNIGVGTATPGAKLDVNGDIFTNSKIAIGITDMNKIGTNSLAVNGSAIFNKAIVKLTGNWPDYVFDSSYHPMPLSTLEKYIKQNKHLPDVPSEKDVQRDGLDLGANQAALLKKIEEFTLIVIEQNKELNNLEVLTKQQSEKIKNLEKLIKQ